MVTVTLTGVVEGAVNELLLDAVPNKDIQLVCYGVIAILSKLTNYYHFITRRDTIQHGNEHVISRYPEPKSSIPP
jgi:hypothetical protein